MEILKRERILKEIYGKVLFDDLKDFFKYINSLEYDIKIFVSKKSYVLYSEIKDFIPTPSNNFVYCTDSAIPVIEKILRENHYNLDKRDFRIAVIDDILIHGRTLKKINDDLVAKGYVFDLFAFCKNINKEQLKDSTNTSLLKLDHIKEKTRAYVTGSDFDWKYISKLIMESFWALNMPLLSFSPFLRLTNRGISLIKNNSSKFIFQSFQNHTQEKMGQKIIYIYSKRYIKHNNTSSISFASLQVNKSLRQGNLLPFSIFSNSDEKKISSLNGVYNVNNCSLFLSNDKALNYKLIIALHSVLFLVKIINDCNLQINKHYSIEWQNVYYSFGKEYYKCFRKIFDDCLTKNKNFDGNVIPCTIYDCRTENSGIQQKLYSELCSIAKSDVVKNKFSKMQVYKYNYLDNCNTLKKIISRYLKFNSNFDEKELNMTITRIDGMRLFDLVVSISQCTQFPLFDIITVLMEQYFIGTATVGVNQIYNTASLYYHAGEQSFKCIIKEFVPLVYFYSVFNKKYCTELAEYIFEKFQLSVQNYYNKRNIKFTNDDFKRYCNLDKDNVYTKTDMDNYLEDRIIGPVCKLGQELDSFIDIYFFKNRRDIPFSEVKYEINHRIEYLENKIYKE